VENSSEGVALAGSPAALIDLLIKDADLNKWATLKKDVLAEAQLIGDGS
jgi:hypothetical protein